MKKLNLLPTMLVVVFVAALLSFAFFFVTGDEGADLTVGEPSGLPTTVQEPRRAQSQPPQQIETNQFRREAVVSEAPKEEEPKPSGPFNLVEVSFKFEQPRFLSGLDINFRSAEFGQRVSYLDQEAQAALSSESIPEAPMSIEVLPNLDEFQTLLFYTYPPPEKGVWQVTVTPSSVTIDQKSIERAFKRRKPKKVRFTVSVAPVPKEHLRASRIELNGTSGVKKTLDYVVLNEKQQALARGRLRLSGHPSHFINLGSVLKQGKPKTLELCDHAGKRVATTPVDERGDMAFLSYYAACAWMDCVEIRGTVTSIADIPFRGPAWIAVELEPWTGSHRPAVYRLARYTPKEQPLYSGPHTPQEYQEGTFSVLVAPGSKLKLRAMLQDPLITGQTQGKERSVQAPYSGDLDVGPLQLR